MFDLDLDAEMLKEDQETKKQFGKMIHKWRSERHYGLEEFATLLGIGADKLSELEDSDSEKFKQFQLIR